MGKAPRTSNKRTSNRLWIIFEQRDCAKKMHPNVLQRIEEEILLLLMRKEWYICCITTRRAETQWSVEQRKQCRTAAWLELMNHQWARVCSYITYKQASCQVASLHRSRLASWLARVMVDTAAIITDEPWPWMPRPLLQYAVRMSSTPSHQQ